MTQKAGLIGCGFFARNHMNAWRELADAEVVAVADVDEERAKRFAAEFGVAHAYASIDELLGRHQLDFLDIVTQPDTHSELVARAAEAGVAVICQKPLAPSLEEARKVVASAASVPLMVHENFRWQRPMRLAREAMGDIGEPFYVRVSFRSGHDVYANQPYLATDERFIIYDLGVHLFDLARYFAGEIENLSCHTASVNPRVRGEDVATALLESRAGAHVVVEMSYASKLPREYFPQTLLHIEGSEGSLLLEPDFRLVVSNRQGTRTIDTSPVRRSWSTPPADVIQDSVVAIQRHWLDCQAAGTAPETNGEDNLKTLELAFSAYDSALRGATVHFGTAGDVK